MRADLSLFPFASMKEKPSSFDSVGVGFGLGLVSCTVLLRIPDRFIAVTLSLSWWLWLVSIPSSRRLFSDEVGCTWVMPGYC